MSHYYYYIIIIIIIIISIMDYYLHHFVYLSNKIEMTPFWPCILFWLNSVRSTT